MKPYKMDMNVLRNNNGAMVGIVDNEKVKDPHGNTVARFTSAWVYDKSGVRWVHFDGNIIKDRMGAKLGTIDQVRRQIDGPGGISLVALWVSFLR